MIFWDTSAFVRCYTPGEPGHDRARGMLLSGERHRASAFIQPELISAVVRRLGRDRRRREAVLRAARGHLKYFDLLAVDDGQLDLAGRLILKHSLRAADALHLSAALRLRRDLGLSRMPFLTADGEQASAARSEGLRVLEI